MPTIVVENLIQQFSVSKPGGSFLSCKEDQQHRNISAMPGQRCAFASGLRIDLTMGLTPVFCCLGTDGYLQGTEEEVRWCVSVSRSSRGLGDSDESVKLLTTRTGSKLRGQRRIGRKCRGFSLWSRTGGEETFWKALGAADMAGSSASEVLFFSVNHSITLMGELPSVFLYLSFPQKSGALILFSFLRTGKVWLITMIFLRVLILLFAGYPLYQDEQERFVCNTIQPGCANVCYDLFSPVSLFRFWLVQLVALCVPYIVFVIYVTHKVSNTLTMDLNSQKQTKAFQMFNKTPLTAEQRGGARCFAAAYILHLIFRTLLEAGFGAAHYYLFGFYVPRRFLCLHPPCTTQVDCYISRPTEKTVMLNFMLGVAALSFLLNVLDFICAIKRSVRQKSKRKVMVEKIFEEEQCFLSAGGASRGDDQEREAQAGQVGRFRKRRGSKGSCGGGICDLGQEPPSTERCSLPRSLGTPGCTANGNNADSVSQEEVPERAGSEVALCPPEPMGTPRSIRVSKRGRLKPPPPPRRDLGLPSVGASVPVGNISTAAAICSRKVGQYTLVELGSGTEPNGDGQEKRSEWV